MSTSETGPRSPSAVAERQGPLLPLRTRWQILFRLYAVQGSWNYELLSGTGIGFCIEPALRRLPGGFGGVAYREALARHCQYFNCRRFICRHLIATSPCRCNAGSRLRPVQDNAVQS